MLGANDFSTHFLLAQKIHCFFLLVDMHSICGGDLYANESLTNE